MWLINTTTLELNLFSDCPSNEYAILSHTWEDGELNFEDFQTIRGRSKKGFWKIQQCCKQAKGEGLRYAWVDTCCIDKRSSAELSEAINSMFHWYKSARTCYAYMTDVSPSFGSDASMEDFSKSRWFTRGWTLQELLAPRVVLFFDAGWGSLGSRDLLSSIIATSTGIDIKLLTGTRQIHDYSIAQRMSWASSRNTTRIEDAAYSLLGIFDVNMPLLYGEGPRAFIRLQEVIIQDSTDETIFAWTGVDSVGSGLLASSPANFLGGAIIEAGIPGEERPPWSNTNHGLAIECDIMPCLMNTYMVPLLCCRKGPDTNSLQMGIYVGRTGVDSQYRRVPVNVEPKSGEPDVWDDTTNYPCHWSSKDARKLLLYIPNVSRSSLISEAGKAVFHFSWSTSPSLERREPFDEYVPDEVVVTNKTTEPDLKARGSFWHSAQEHLRRRLCFRRQGAVVILQSSLETGEYIDHIVIPDDRSPIHKLKFGFDKEFLPVCFVSAANDTRLDYMRLYWGSCWTYDHYPGIRTWTSDTDRVLPPGYPSDLTPHYAEADEYVHSEDLEFRAFRGHRLHGFIATTTEYTGEGTIKTRLCMYPRRKEENANGLHWNVTMKEIYKYQSYPSALDICCLFPHMFLYYRIRYPRIFLACTGILAPVLAVLACHFAFWVHPQMHPYYELLAS